MHTNPKRDRYVPSPFWCPHLGSLMVQSNCCFFLNFRRIILMLL